jgi:hypothetical protein
MVGVTPDTTAARRLDQELGFETLPRSLNEKPRITGAFSFFRSTRGVMGGSSTR